MIQPPSDTKRERLAKVLIMGALSAALGAMVLAPTRARSAHAHSALDAARVDMASAPQSLGDLASLRTRLAAYQDALDRVPRASEASGGRSVLHEQVEQLADEMEVSIRALNVGAPSPIASGARGEPSDISETRVSLRAEGTYASIAAFLDAYSRRNGVVAFGDTRILASDVPGDDVVSLSLEVSHLGLLDDAQQGAAP